MSEINSDPITETITLILGSQPNGQYTCEISTTLSDAPTSDISCHGQTKEHSIAIALEKLAAHYRQITEECQNQKWDTVELNEAGKPVNKRYHVTLYYERIARAKSKFDAIHDTILGNTVIENATINVVEITPGLNISV